MTIGLAVLGSTGSVGRQTLQVVESLSDRFDVVALSAGGNVTLLEEQARRFKPRMVWASRQDDYVRDTLIGRGRARWAELDEMAADPRVDIVVLATVGAAGLGPAIAALRAGKAVALANKEVLVMAGQLLVEEARKNGGELRPVDSEHSAIWQCLWGESNDAIDRIILTASGGPFRDMSVDELSRVTAEEALKHPNWEMGKKITVDSATLLNKGLECIEARWLFDVPLERIDVLLHRESIIHSMVEFRDGSIKAQLGVPDMRLPIQCALTYPERLASDAVPKLDLRLMSTLNFAVPSLRKYRCLSLALQAGRKGGTYPAALAAADEIAVQHFLGGYIRFTDIANVLDDVLSAHKDVPDPGLDDLLAADQWARAYAEDWVKAKA
jgi:1-deoxy-D-xylulose-5-phosphate reductoisomerase